jgi:hypothetical protein
MKLISSLLKNITLKNLHKTIKSFDKGVGHFNKALSDFGYSMDSITNELGSDIEKSKENHRQRESINKANLDKIWGKKK